ncbi:MAG: heme lyase CcmF/NrfE family subunit, partial [Rhodospirillales bacterium]
AYYELGWGGFWFWDPVENASFMPWLAGTALLHSSIVVEKRNAMKAWTVFLAIVAFSFSLLGTFLVRSGVLTSVHAFATDPERGVFILLLLIIVIGGSFALFAWRGPQLKSEVLFQPISREGGLLLNNLVMTVAAAAVLLGTLYPLFIDAIDGSKVSVGAPFFNAVFIPLMMPMIFAMAVGPLLSWKRAELGPAFKSLWIAAVAMFACVAATWAIITDGPVMGLVGVALATWLGVGTLISFAEKIKLFRVSAIESLSRLRRTPRATLGMTMAHFGVAIAIAGITGAGAWKVESVQVMKPGEKVTVSGYEYEFKGASSLQGPNYTISRALFIVRKDGKVFTSMEPEKRFYPVQNMPTTEAAIHSTLWGDLYVVVGDPQGTDGGFVTRIYFNPLVIWMWVGGLLMMSGGFLSLTDRRYRIGAPTRRQARAAPVAAE